ncbi:sensor histidine kinase [Acutalibacter sp. 1XD8-36]|uniref:sensor histidine kinase n=1 Tax=Acutalibacter sp. 1XD8-36 TaxID=2320852 RepID=UPI002602F5D3|nr:histidine kinase [Acutalibacter sp. 1XD8-36]
MKKKFVFTTFHKTCAIFLAALLIITAGSFVQYRQGMELLRQESVNSANGAHRYMKNILDTELNRILILQDVLNNNWDINKLSILKDEYSFYARSEAIGNIKDKLWAVQSSSRVIESLHVYIADIDTRIGTYTSLPTMEQEHKLYEHLADYPKNKIIYENGQMILLTESAYFSKNYPDRPSFFIQATFSNLSLAVLLSSQITESMSNMALLYPSSGIILSGEPVPGDIEEQLLPLANENLPTDGTTRLSIGKQSYTVLCSRLAPSDIYLMQYLSDEMVNEKLRPMSYIISLFIGFMVCAGLFFSFSIYKIIHMPLKQLVEAYQSVENGDLNTRIEPSGPGEFHYLYQGFDRMLERLQEYVHLAYEQKMLAQRSELKQLQSQIDPHFLFNSFFILNKRIRSDDTDGALQLSKLLGSYFQYITRNGRDFVPLAEEVGHMKNYCEIQKIRFRNRLTLELEPPPPDIAEVSVPRLILQPICENSIKYAVENRTEDSVLRLRYHMLGGNLFEILLDDNGSITDDEIRNIEEKLRQTDSEEITGLSNINRRLQLRYGPGCGLELGRGELGGLRIVMRLRREQAEFGGKDV